MPSSGNRSPHRRDRLFIGGTALMSVPRGRPGRDGKHGHVVNYRHVIHALKRKPAALLSLAYREQLFPRDAYRHMFDHLLARVPEREACRTMVSLLLLAHERGCEAELAGLLEADRVAGLLPDLGGLRATVRTRSGLAARLSLILNELRLPTIKQLWPGFAERADKEGWPAARFLAAIAEHGVT